MGAGGHLRWVEHPQLRSMMDAVIDGIEECAEADGYLAAFTQEKLATDEHPDYTTSWTVHGFLEAAIAGNTKALQMIRRHMNVFNNHSLIPTFLPPGESRVATALTCHCGGADSLATPPY